MAGPAGRLRSVNVGMPKDVAWQGKTVFTGVFKDPVTGPRRVRRLNVDGDGQGDRAGHGGEQRAVFVYQTDSYRYWERELGRNDFVDGQFGENFTVEGLSDAEVCIGDRYRIGTAVFEVTQPRVTCYRVGIRLNDPRIPALLVSHRRPGFYFRVLEEGDVEAGDEIVKLASGPEQMTVAEIDALLYLPGHPRQQLLRALRIPALSPGWQASFKALLEGERGGGNAGLVATSPPPAWAGFRPLTVTAIERESDSMISISLEDPDGEPLPAAGPGQYLTLRLRPDDQERSVLRNYSLSGRPGAGGYRITVKREEQGAASGYLHTRVAVGDRLEVAAPRGTFILAETRAPVLLISAGIGATPVLAMLHALAAEHSEPGDLVAPRRTQQPRPAVRGRGPRAARLAPERAQPRVLQPPRARTTSKVATSTTPVGSRLRCSPSSSRRATPRRTSAGRRRSWRRSAPVWPRSASAPARSTPSRSGPRPARPPASRPCPRGRPIHPRAHPGAARRSSSRAATSRSRGATTTRACSTSPRRATSPSAGRAAPASATAARRRSSRAPSPTTPTRSNRPPTAAR